MHIHRNLLHFFNFFLNFPQLKIRIKSHITNIIKDDDARETFFCEGTMKKRSVFVLAVVARVTTSFFTPITFQRHFSSSISRTILWGEDESDDNSNMIRSLDHFVSVVDKLNEGDLVSDCFQIVSRGSNNLPPNENTEIKVFYEPNDMKLFIAITQEKHRIDISKIHGFFSSAELLIPVPADMVQSLCGFPGETLPPIGQYFASNISSSTIILDKTLVRTCQENDLLLLGSAGHPYWRSLLSVDDLLSSLRNETDSEVRIEDIIMTDDENGNDEDDDNYMIGSPKFSNKISTEILFNKGTKLNPSGSLDQLSLKPYFPIDGPPMNIARLIARQKEISNPLSPVFVTVVGQIGKIITRNKKSLLCEFLPPSWGKRNNNNDDEKNEIENISHPWRSVTHNNRGMAVELVFGKALLKSLGSKQGENLIERIQEGQLFFIEAKTNPGQRESITKWVDNNCLELSLLDCQLLSGDDSGTILKENPVDSNSEISQRKKMGLSASSPTLTLDDVFNKSSISVFKYVDDLDSIADFSNDISQLILQSNNDNNPSSPSPLVGIDCEWQPREFMESKNQPQPVLLLQISIHALQTVFLLDLQALLRPLKHPNTSMNKLEREVSITLTKIMQSKRFIFVGYQISSDLRRMVSSYPHLTCFLEVHSVIEISSLIKRVLRISKQKKSRYITMSLASMTAHYLGMTLDKEHRKWYE